MIDHFPLPLQGREERRHLYRWIAAEEKYVAGKFDDQRNGHDESTATYDLGEFWTRQIVQYLDRATAFLAEAKCSNGDDRRRLEMLAQQALAKGFMTFKGCVESSIRVFGDMPSPGVPSGTVRPWGLHWTLSSEDVVA